MQEIKRRSQLSPGGMGSTIWTPKPPSKAIKTESNVQVGAPLCEQIHAPRRISPTAATDLEFFIWTFNPTLFPHRSQTHRIFLNFALRFSPERNSINVASAADNPSDGRALIHFMEGKESILRSIPTRADSDRRIWLCPQRCIQFFTSYF